MNCIFLDGHSYTPDELRALIADRDQWQEEANRLRAENARLTAAEADSHAAIALLATENASTAAPEALEALEEAMDAEDIEHPDDIRHKYPEPCGFVRADGKRCYRLAHAGTPDAHWFSCKKLLDNLEECWLSEGHEGPCQQAQF